MGRRRAGSSRRVGASSLRWRAASSRRAAASSLRRRAASSRGPFLSASAGSEQQEGFFCCFGTGSTPPVVEPAVMALLITVKLNPTPLKTGGDGHFEPAVMRGAGVVNQSG